MILGFNTTQAPFDKPDVRRALAWAIPYKDIVNGLFAGHALASEGPIPVQGQNHDAPLWTISTDVDKAKQMLADAGFPTGFAFTLDIDDGNPTAQQIAVVLKDSFSKIGVDMTINVQPASVFSEGLGKLSHQAWMRDLLWYVDDAGYTGELFFKTKAVANWMGYSNPDLDKIIAKLGATDDPAEKQKLADDYQNILIKDSPTVAIVDMPFEIAMRDNIQGYVQLPDNLLWYWPLKRAQ
jgi:peptide/nickel transport system substrate-binding protein